MIPSRPADVLDSDIFHELRGSLAGKPDALVAVYLTFLGNAAGFVGALRNQEAAARAETLHTLKGSAAMLGANRLATLAARLQIENPQSPARAGQAVEELAGELARFRQVIAAQLQSLGYSIS